MSDNDNQSTHKTGRLTSRSKSPKDAIHGPEIKPQKDGDDVIGAIEGVEKQLNALRDAHEEHRKLTTDLATRRVQIDEFAEQIEARESELTTNEVELAEMRQDLEDREAEIVQRASGLEQRESQIAQHADRIEELEAVVETKAEKVDQRIEELDNQLEGISIRKDELAKLEVQAKERLEQDSKLEIEIQELDKELDRTKASLGGREIELKERAKVVEDLAVQAGLLEKQMGELTVRSKNDETESLEIIEEMQTRLDESLLKVKAHDEAMQRALTRIDELESISATRGDDLDKATTRLEELGDSEKASTKSKAGSMKQIAELQDQLAQSKGEFKSVKEALDASPSDKQFAEIQKKLDQSSKQLKDSQAATKELESQIQSIGSNATKEIESSGSQIAKLNTDLNQARSELKNSIGARADLQRDLQSKLDKAIKTGKQLQSSSGSDQSTIAELHEQLAGRDKQIATIQAQHEEISAQLLTEQGSSSEAQAKISQMGDIIEAAGVQEQELTQELAELNELVASEQSKGRATTDEWTASRRERLSRVKSILRLQSYKIRRATEALRDRYDQCEQVLLKRTELVEAYQAISEAQTKLAKREARSGTLLGLSGIGLLVMMIAGASWFIAGQVVPGTYASRVTLTAKAGERALTTEDIASWQGYVEGLVTDPQFIEQAAARMKRRGISDLAIAGSLSAHMSESLDVVSAEPGKIEFEYRGDGSARTQRILDTFALTITSQANAARARRIDGALTSIESTSTLGDAPLDSARIETAGKIFGGSTLGTFVFGGIFWRRLAKVKANFERDNRVDPLFDEDSWEVDRKSA